MTDDSEESYDDEEDEFVIPVSDATDLLEPWKYNPEFGLIVTTHAVSFLAGVIGNFLVIFMMTRGRDRAAKSATSLFLMSLAVSDLLLLLLLTPLQTLEYFANHWIKGGFVCKMQSYVEMLSATASVLNLTAVSLERYIVIVHPMRSRSFCTRRNCRLALIGVWGFSLLLSGPAVLTRDSHSYEYRDASNRTVDVHTCIDFEKSSRLVIDTTVTNFTVRGVLLPPGVYDLTLLIRVYKHLESQGIGSEGISPDQYIPDKLSSPMFDAKMMLAVYQLLIMFVLPLILMGACYVKVIQELWLSTKQITALTRCYSISQSRDAEPNGNILCRSKSRYSLSQRSSLGSSISVHSDRQKRGKGKLKPTSSLTLQSSTSSLRVLGNAQASATYGRANQPGYTAKTARKQVIKMLIIIIILFLLCWGPRLIFNVVMKFGIEEYTKGVYYFRVTVYLLPFIHSCLNPVIYTVMSSNFRRVMLRTCRRRKRASPCSSFYVAAPLPSLNPIPMTLYPTASTHHMDTSTDSSPNNQPLNNLSDLNEDDEGPVA